MLLVVVGKRCGHKIWGAVFTCLLGAQAQTAELEFNYGLDVFTDTQGTLDAFQSISAIGEIGNDLHFGQSLYSATAGDAGGLFVGGFTLAKRWQIGTNTQVELSGFIGGGGGAALVGGDGLMMRSHISLRHRFFDQISGHIGLSYIDISGSVIAAPALSFGLSRNTDFAMLGGHQGHGPKSGRVLRAVKPLIKQFHPNSNLTRSGRALNTMTLVGVEATFAASPNAHQETFIQSTGAMAGDGEGYADIQVGLRVKTANHGLRAFGEVATGFGGGGDVDTGGGLLASVGAGVALPLLRGFDLEIGAQASVALDGDLRAFVPFVRGALHFGDQTKPYQTPRHWQLGMGLSLQRPNADYRKAGIANTKSPVLIETSADLFIDKRLYLTGNAQTVASGDAGGYAIGLLGAGYEFPLSKRWKLSLEAHLGAAGGGGVDTGGGLVAVPRIELDYALNDRLAISAALGLMQTLRGDGGARPMTINLGLKTTFSSFH